MSKNEPLTIWKDGQAEFTVQRSRFIAYAAAVRSEEEARAFVARLRKEHYDARHCCSAWILGADGAKQKSSDDGEPGGTAGMPILETMKRRGLTDAAVAVAGLSAHTPTQRASASTRRRWQGASPFAAWM